MKLNDAVWGGLLMLLAAAVLVHVQSFPAMPGQQVGPALFPGVIAVALAVCAVLLIGNGVRERRGGEAPWVILDDWVRSPRHLLAFAAVIGVNVFYILAVDALGFILTGTAYLAILFVVFRVPLARVLPLAVSITLGIHYAFYKLLKVPLPWGVLKGIAW